MEIHLLTVWRLMKQFNAMVEMIKQACSPWFSRGGYIWKNMIRIVAIESSISFEINVIDVGESLLAIKRNNTIFIKHDLFIEPFFFFLL